MIKNHFRHPLNFNFTENPIVGGWTFGPQIFVALNQPTNLREKVIWITGITGFVYAQDLEAALSYDVTDKIGVGLNGTISNGSSNNTQTRIFLKFNKPWYPFFLQLEGSSSNMSFVFYFNGGDWPGPIPSPTSNYLTFTVNMNVHFETEEP